MFGKIVGLLFMINDHVNDEKGFKSEEVIKCVAGFSRWCLDLLSQTYQRRCNFAYDAQNQLTSCIQMMRIVQLVRDCRQMTCMKLEDKASNSCQNHCCGEGIRRD